MSKKSIILNDAQIAQVEALASYLTIEDIANYLGIGETTFYEIKNRQPSVSEAYKRGVAKARAFVGSRLMGYIKEQENTPIKLNAIIFYLKTQAGWSEKSQIDVNTKNVTPLVAPQIIFEVYQDKNEKPAE